MSDLTIPAGVDLQGLLSLFPPTDYLDGFELVPADEVPEPYHRLLVHQHHMTVTVESHHGGPVDVRVLAQQPDGDTYARKILLTLQKTGRVVQFGIMRIHLRFCTAPVRAAILAARTPLGRILIEHNVLRRIKPVAFLRVVPGPAMMEWFGLDSPQPTYGRLAMLHCDGNPAVELLEIVAPE
jgi:hypothetical protein